MDRRFLLIPLLTLAGCASSSGFHRDELRTELTAAQTTDDADIAKALALKPQLPKPFRIGVYFQQPEAHGDSAKALWRWTGEDKEKILTAAKKLQDAHEVSQIFELSSSVVKGSDMRSLRLAAAKHGADALLVVGGVNETDSYFNKWGWTYFAILPALFVPASETNVLFLSHATLWDVRNQFLYLNAEAESEKRQTRAAAFTDERKVVGEAKDESVTRLRDEIERMAAGLITERQAKN